MWSHPILVNVHRQRCLKRYSAECFLNWQSGRKRNRQKGRQGKAEGLILYTWAHLCPIFFSLFREGWIMRFLPRLSKNNSFTFSWRFISKGVSSPRSSFSHHRDLERCVSQKLYNQVKAPLVPQSSWRSVPPWRAASPLEDFEQARSCLSCDRPLRTGSLLPQYTLSYSY